MVSNRLYKLTTSFLATIAWYEATLGFLATAPFSSLGYIYHDNLQSKSDVVESYNKFVFLHADYDKSRADPRGQGGHAP